jgi:hypothetical protein
MHFLHYKVETGPGYIIQVNLTGTGNVRLLDPATAGPETTNPVKFVPPFRGSWHVVVDLEGQVGAVRASVDVLRA